ncbi:MAG: cytochrome C554 [Methanobacteriota archaeon]|nr:MAG: cytochrome C554 [Euryarchaeota archaeon]
MKQLLIAIPVIAVLVFGNLWAQETQRTYVGVRKCKTCHKKPEQGEQYRIWSESKHAKAYETLGGPEAMKIAKEKGIENPQEAPECLKCHVTAYGVDAKFLGPKYKKEDGVGCESCHGPGGDYYKKKTMKAIRAGEIDPASVGLIKPDEKVCTKCHNEESPNYKPFNFEEFKKKIAHPIPQ